MVLLFNFQDEQIAFETYLTNHGLHVLEGKNEMKYSPEQHAAKVAKVFKGMLRQDVSERVKNGEFETIGNMLYEGIEKLKDVIYIFEKGINLCEQLQIEKEKLSLTIETTVQ